jgi:rhomboid protease GluP
VTYVLLGLTILVYLLQVGTEFAFGVDLPAAYGLKRNDLIAQGQLWRLITPVFLHGSILHIGFNMYALYIFGPGLERHFGHARYTALYFLSGFGGNVISMMFTVNPSLGSSTAIFGLLGAQGMFLFQNQEVLGRIARRALSNIISVALINLLIGLSPGIDNWGHLGGLAGGTLFTWLGGPLLSVEGVFPPYSLVDRRESGDVLRAILIVGLFFVFLVVGALYLRAGVP